MPAKRKRSDPIIHRKNWLLCGLIGDTKQAVSYCGQAVSLRRTTGIIRADGWYCDCGLFTVSLVCYLLYYHLDSVRGYYDGMIPLVIVAVMTVVVSITM